MDNSVALALPLPYLLPADSPYCYHSTSIHTQSSRATVFNTDLDRRDVVTEGTEDGRRICVICGMPSALEHAHIIPRNEPDTWAELKHRRYIPQSAKSVEYEPRNGLTLCRNHHYLFHSYTRFYIRFHAKKYVLVNHSQQPEMEEYHGKAICLKPFHQHSPFPSIFLLHEARVRAFCPWKGDRVLPDDPPYQDWFNANYERVLNTPSASQPLALAHSSCTDSTGGGSSHSLSRSPDGVTLSLDQASIQKVLKATWESPSWKACIIENTTWDGTAEENAQKYKEVMGISSEDVQIQDTK